jgi:hypothetical protein
MGEPLRAVPTFWIDDLSVLSQRTNRYRVFQLLEKTTLSRHAQVCPTDQAVSHFPPFEWAHSLYYRSSRCEDRMSLRFLPGDRLGIGLGDTPTGFGVPAIDRS